MTTFKHILIAYTDAGCGHKATDRAIRAVLEKTGYRPCEPGSKSRYFQSGEAAPPNPSANRAVFEFPGIVEKVFADRNDTKRFPGGKR